jgi:hypothetical protein
MPKDKYQRPKSKSQRIKPFAPKSQGPISVKARLDDITNNNNIVSNQPILKEDHVIEDDVTPTLVVEDDVTPPFEVDDVHLTKDNIVVIYIANHGNYDVNNEFKYKIIECPVKKLIRLQYAPYNTCAWADNALRLTTYDNLRRELSVNFYDSITDESEIIHRLTVIGEKNKTAQEITEDNYAQKGIELGIADETKINLEENIKKSNAVLTNYFGDELIDKRYNIDHTDLRGIPILFNVTFRLPDIFFSNSDLKNYLTSVIQPQRNYLIGQYNESTQEITYMANTELLSCPFFSMFANITNGIRQEIGFSIVDGLPLTRRPMIDSVTTEIIYKYFQYADMVINLDYSCSRFKYSDKAEEQLQNPDALDKINALQNPIGARGGHKKTKKRTNKRRPSKRRTKRRPNKYYMKTT